MFGEHVRVWGHASRRDGSFSCVAFLGLVGRAPRGGHRAAARAGVGENPTGPALRVARAQLIQTDVFTRCLRNTTVRRGPLGSLNHETLRLEPRRAADRGVCRRGGGGQHRDERAPGGPAAPHLRVRADRRRDPVLPAPESICLLGQHAQVPGGHGERALRRHRPPLQRPQIRARRPRRRRHAQTASVDR